MHSILPPTPLRSGKLVYDNEPLKITTTPINRPQSPRQFFEKLYGHLETTVVASSGATNEVGKFNPCEKPIGSPVRSEISSSSDYIERYINRKRASNLSA